MPCFVLGGGTNILVSDKGVRGVVLDLTLLSGLQTDGTRVTALGGTPVSALSEHALSDSLAGMEFAYALPGSVGGAVWMNARCYEREVSDVLEFVDYLDPDLGQQRLPMRPDEWAYKLSPFQGRRGVILKAGFRLAPGVPGQIEERMQEHRQGPGKERPLPVSVRGKRVQEQPRIRRAHGGAGGFPRAEGAQDRRRAGGALPWQHHHQHGRRHRA